MLERKRKDESANNMSLFEEDDYQNPFQQRNEEANYLPDKSKAD